MVNITLIPKLSNNFNTHFHYTNHFFCQMDPAEAEILYTLLKLIRFYVNVPLLKLIQPTYSASNITHLIGGIFLLS